MLLIFPTGEPFATGATSYDYSSLPGSDLSDRLVLTVEIEGQMTSAILDTGAPYLVCAPALAWLLGFTPAAGLAAHRLLIRGHWVAGHLHRVGLTLLSTAGENLHLEATAFVPDAEQGVSFPSFLGLSGCLERLRFAVDPVNNTFYFGGHP